MYQEYVYTYYMETSDALVSKLAAQALQVCLCFHARKSSRAISQLFDQILSPTGLKATQISLLMVVAAKGPVRIGDLASSLVTDSTSVSRTIRPLVAKNLLRVGRDPSDGRIRMIHLTSEGQQLLETALPLWRDAQRKSVNKLGNSLVQALLPALEETSLLGATDPRQK